MTSSANTTGFHSSNLSPTLNEQAMRAITDDECVTRLASAVDRHDDRSLTEVVMLISRLAVTIE